MNPTVSIIVPVYNAGKSLQKCIDSILKQTCADFELLLVDDGSTDGSAEVCDSYVCRDERIRVIHKQNTGVSDSRNTAIELARGKYLQFVDSDDWITPDATALFVRTASEHQCDLVISDFYRVSGSRVSHKGDIQDDRLMTREEFMLNMMEKPADFYYGVLWNKLFRRDLVEKYHLRMNTEMSWCEDFMFNLEYIRHIKNVYPLHVPVYYYVKTKGSLSSQALSITRVLKMKHDVFEYYNSFYKDIFAEEDYAKSRVQVYGFLIDSARDGFVLPGVSGAVRLGRERTSVSAEALEGGGILMDTYREQKLLDRYLEIPALKNDITLPEARLMLYLSQPHESCSRRELAEFTGLTMLSLSRALQKLTARSFITVKEIHPKKHQDKAVVSRKTEITLLPESAPILDDIKDAADEFYRIKISGLTADELAQLTTLLEKVKSNICKALK